MLIKSERYFTSMHQDVAKSSTYGQGMHFVSYVRTHLCSCSHRAHHCQCTDASISYLSVIPWDNCQPSNRFNVLPDQAMPRPLPTSAYPSNSSSLISRPATPPQMSVPQWRPVTWTPSPPQAQMPKLDSDARSHVNPPGLPYIQPQGHLTHVPQGSFRSQSPQQASHSFVMAQGRAPANRVLMGHQRPVPQQLASQWQQSGWQNQGFMQELHAEQARPPQQNTAGQQHHQGINQANAFYATPPGIFRHITELCVCDCAVCLRECVCVRVRVCVCTIATYDILLRCK